MSKMEDGVSEISQKDVYDTEDPFFEVRACLEKGDTLRAQQLLESFSERGAEWQYMQAIVFREKKWYTEARRCLKRALKESPENETYQKEYDELRKRENQKSPKPKRIWAALPRIVVLNYAVWAPALLFVRVA